MPGPAKISLRDCATAIKEAAGESMTDHEADSLIKAIERKIENLNSSRIDSLETKIAKIGEDLTGEIDAVNAVNKRNALMSIGAVRKLIKSARAYKTPFEGMLAFLEDSRRNLTDAGRGVNAIVEGYKNKFLGDLKAGLMKSDTLKEFMADSHEKEIFQEFYEPGSSGSKKAADIRELLFGMKQQMVKLQNAYGSYIHFLPEHVKRQTYNTNLIKKNFGPDRFQDFFNFNRHLDPAEYTATFNKWKEFMMPLLDHEETFKDEDKDKFMRGAFDGIMSGVHGTTQPATGAEINAQFFKAGSMAKKVSTQRLFHFKDGDSAYAAHKSFSAETLSRGVLSEFNHAATNIGLMQQMGPNPIGTLSETISQLEHEYSRSGEEAKLKSIQDNKHKLYSALGFLDKTALVPANPTLQTATSTAISLLSMGKLGKMLFFAIPDRALMQSMLTRNGMKGMDALASAFKMTKPSNPDERLRLVMLGGEARSFTNHVSSRFTTGSEAGVPSVIMNTQRAFFNMTGIHWFDDVGASAVVGALPRHLGAMSDRSFDKIIPELRNMLNSYGITPDDWDAWRSTAYHTDEAGKKVAGMHNGLDNWITPDQFKDIPDSRIDVLLKSKGENISDNNRMKERDLLENKYFAWITAQRDEAIPMPGSKEHRLASFGTQPGTALGSMTRMLMMFKTFPISVYTKVLKRELQGNGARTVMEWLQSEKNSNFHTTQLIAMSTIAGYIALTAEDLVMGKNPRSFTKRDGSFDSDTALDVLKESFLRGGAGGLQADLMLREYDSGRNNIVKAVGGPAVGLGIDAAAAASATLRGKEKGQSALNLLRDNMPLANLFYIKPAIDHLVWFNIQEMLDPGSLKQQELNRKEKYNQDYWLPPSEVHRELLK